MKKDEIFQRRLERYHDELRWLYMELYQNGDMFAELCERLHGFYSSRKARLRKRDESREK